MNLSHLAGINKTYEEHPLNSMYMHSVSHGIMLSEYISDV